MIYPIVTIPLVRILSRGDRLQRALYGAALPALQQPTCSQVEGYPRGTARWEDWAIWAFWAIHHPSIHPSIHPPTHPSIHPSIHPPTTPINKTYLSLHLTKKGTNGNGTYTSFFIIIITIIISEPLFFRSMLSYWRAREARMGI